MEWVCVDDFMPGYKKKDVVVLLSNGEIHFLDNREITGTWLSKDSLTHCVVTHWFEIQRPKSESKKTSHVGS